MELTTVILVKNEEENIENVVRSVDFSDEIVVVDDDSTDRTVGKIQNLKIKNQKYKEKIKIFRHTLNQDFGKQRNYALSKASGDWVLFVDADEKVTSLLRREIIKSTKSSNQVGKQISKFSAYCIRRKNLFLGKVVGEDKVLRLAKKDAGKWQRIVHEVWKVNGKVGKLDGYLVHATAGSLKEVISKTNFYSSLHAKQNTKDGKRSNLFKIIFFPKAKFIQNVITKKGFLLGLLHSFHSFLAWSKLWLFQKDSAKNQ